MKKEKYFRSTNYDLIMYFMQGAKLYFSLCIVFAALSSLFDMVAPQVIRITIDNVFGSIAPANGSFINYVIDTLGGKVYLQTHLWILALIIVVSSLFKVLNQYLFRVTNAKASETFLKNMRDNLFIHIENLPYEWHTANKTGDILQRTTTDVETVKNFFTEQLIALFRITLLLLSSIYFMIKMNISLTLLSLIPMPFILTYSLRYFKQVGERFRECDENQDVLSSICQENLTGVRVVRAFGREKYELDKFQNQNSIYTILWERMSRIMSRYWSTADFLSGMQVMLVVAIGAAFCVNSRMTSGEYLAFVAYNYKLIWPIRMLGRMLSEMSKAGVSINRIKQIMDVEEENGESDIKPSMNADIKFENVSFSYGNNKVINNISFTIPAGTTLGILGGTGCGKSTLMLLLDKLFLLHKDEGKITIGGVDINDIDTKYLRENIGFVLQESFLFSRSIADNIGITQKEIDLEDIRAAAKTSSLDDAVMSFTKGYDTFVGERGVTLSGGQKQRVSIARMLTQNAPIMIFDDSFSAIDTETDMRIRHALEQKFGTATIILISHRLTTISKADNIIVMEQGSIVEQGTHEELVKNGGIYQKIYEIQSGVEEAVMNEN